MNHSFSCTKSGRFSKQTPFHLPCGSLINAKWERAVTFTSRNCGGVRWKASDQVAEGIMSCSEKGKAARQKMCFHYFLSSPEKNGISLVLAVSGVFLGVRMLTKILGRFIWGLDVWRVEMLPIPRSDTSHKINLVFPHFCAGFSKNYLNSKAGITYPSDKIVDYRINSNNQEFEI